MQNEPSVHNQVAKLKDQYDDKERQLDLLLKKLSRLEEKRLIETEEGELFKLDQQIKKIRDNEIPDKRREKQELEGELFIEDHRYSHLFKEGEKFEREGEFKTANNCFCEAHTWLDHFIEVSNSFSHKREKNEELLRLLEHICANAQRVNTPKNSQEALEEYQKALKIDSSYVPAIWQVANIYEQDLRDYQKAVERYIDCYDKDMQNTTCNHEYAQKAFKKIQEIERYYLRNGTEEAYEELAQLYTGFYYVTKEQDSWNKRDILDKICHIGDTILERNPIFKLGFKELENLKRERLPEGILTALEALKNCEYGTEEQFANSLDEVIGKDLDRKAILNQAKKPNYHRARKFYERVWDLDKNHQRAIYAIGDGYFKEGKYVQAKNRYIHYIKHGIPQPDDRDKDKTEAFENVLAIETYYLNQIENYSNSVREAFDIYKEILAEGNDRHIGQTLYKILDSLEHYADQYDYLTAISIIKDIQDYTQDKNEYYYDKISLKLAEIYGKSGDFRKAIETFKAILKHCQNISEDYSKSQDERDLKLVIEMYPVVIEVYRGFWGYNDSVT